MNKQPSEQINFREQAKERHAQDEKLLDVALALSGSFINPAFSVNSLPEIEGSEGEDMLVELQCKMLGTSPSKSPDVAWQAEKFHNVCGSLAHLSYSRVSLVNQISNVSSFSGASKIINKLVFLSSVDKQKLVTYFEALFKIDAGRPEKMLVFLKQYVECMIGIKSLLALLCEASKDFNSRNFPDTEGGQERLRMITKLINDSQVTMEILINLAEFLDKLDVVKEVRADLDHYLVIFPSVQKDALDGEIRFTKMLRDIKVCLKSLGDVVKFLEKKSQTSVFMKNDAANDAANDVAVALVNEFRDFARSLFDSVKCFYTAINKKEYADFCSVSHAQPQDNLFSGKFQGLSASIESARKNVLASYVSSRSSLLRIGVKNTQNNLLQKDPITKKNRNCSPLN